MKRKRDSGSPCQRPRVDEMHPFIHLRHFEANPFATRMFSRKVQSTLSKAFSKSSLMTTPICFFLSHSSASSFSMRDASRSCCPYTKAVCFSVIVKGRTFLRRFDDILAMILYSPVVRLMGQKSACGHPVSLKSNKCMFRLGCH